MRTRTAASGAALLAGALLAPGCGRPAAAEAPRYVGAETCGRCHEREAELWRGSDHFRSMEVPGEATVEGDFDGATFDYFGLTSSFTRRGDRFFLRTDGADGRLAEFPVAYTFGFRPLQQYLVEFPGGRYQVSSLCWDTRPEAEGGQRWFHLYPEEPTLHEDPLHWTGPNQNWNFMCADCHSTNLRRNYDAERDAYATSWSELNVACEACHGPGSRHVAWAEAASRAQPDRVPEDDGLVVHLSDPAEWVFGDGSATAARSVPRRSDAPLEACLPCHSLRTPLTPDPGSGEPFLDHYRPVLLEEPLYFADGQIREEVYEHGSFLQSGLHAAGVACSDCHDPHSLRPPARGNELCARCHLASAFDTPAHHFHGEESPGSRCVECHMPGRFYMVVDFRRDHRFGVPRPDLTVQLGVPNACNGCHADRTPEWALEAARSRWGPEPFARPDFATALDAGRRGLPGAERELARLGLDATLPSIVRATALSLLRRYPGSTTAAALEAAARDPEPLVCLGTAAAAEVLAPAERIRVLFPLLDHPLRAVRVEAATAVASLPEAGLTSGQREAWRAGLEEYRRAQLVNADRAGARLNLGRIALHLGDLQGAEEEYRAALRLAPRSPEPYVSLADLLRMRGRDADGEELLRRGLALCPGSGDLEHALGLLLVRRGRRAEALAALERAAALRPDEPHYAYVLAVALQEAGERPRADAVLSEALSRHPGDPELLLAAATMARDAGRTRDALEHARRLAERLPDDPGARVLLQELAAAER